MRLYALFQRSKGMTHSSMMSQDWAMAVSSPSRNASRAKKLSSKVRDSAPYSRCSSLAGRFTSAVKKWQSRLSGHARATAPSRHKTPRTALPATCRPHQASTRSRQRRRQLSS